ncbi:hypothetical protein OUZ56_012228 [Daphnia magna]|uniref:Uncharacterized protein n=1 Tax=Daphnia magna TaxID=35525 RepID=A0ABQ9Z2D7_9CRUS|nr:hypothetical protein OUZ56_012228 [Daphnia magna]
MTGKSGSNKLTSQVDSDILVDEEATTTANKLTLEEYLLRLGNRIKLQNMSSLFSIKENIITCLMKQSNSAIYIEATILRAKEDSKSTMVSMGVMVSDAECFNFDNRLAWKMNQAVRQNELSNELDVDEECESIENQGNDFLDEVDSFDASVLTSISNADFKDYREILERNIVSNCNELGNKNFSHPRFGPLCDPTHLIESSPFVLLTSDDGSQKMIKNHLLYGSVRMVCANKVMIVLQG